MSLTPFFPDPHSNFTTSTTPLTTCVVPVYASGVLSAFNTVCVLISFWREELAVQWAKHLPNVLTVVNSFTATGDNNRLLQTA